MTAFPHQLSAWQPWLSWFDTDHIAALLPLLRTLDTSVSALCGQQLAGEPEFAGLEDLRRRGNYQRLLLSEWIYADEVPDEFLRRAAQGEHLFLEPSFRQPKAAQPVYAIFDCGPSQLGAARLIHIALWIVLARRAQNKATEFRFQAAQADGDWRVARDVEDLRWLLTQRSFSAWDTANCDARLDNTVGERWIIGSTNSVTQNQCSELVCAIDLELRSSTSPEIADNAIDQIKVEKNQQAYQQLLAIKLTSRWQTKALTLPVPDAAAGLLHGVFFRQRDFAHLEPYDDQSGVTLVMSKTASRLALLRGRNALIYALPRAMQSQRVKPELASWAVGTSPLALCFHGKRLCGLLHGADQLRSWGLPLGSPSLLDGLNSLTDQCAFIDTPEPARFLLLHGTQLLSFDAPRISKTTAEAPSWKLLSEDVLAFDQLGPNRLAMLVREQDALRFYDRASSTELIALKGRTVKHVYLQTRARKLLGAAVLGTELWMQDLLSPSEQVLLNLPEGCTPLGVVDYHPHLTAVLWHRMRASIYMYNASEQRLVYESPEMISHAKISFCGNFLAMLTTSGELDLLELSQGKVVRLQTKLVTDLHA
jgi:hypothetical protein